MHRGFIAAHWSGFHDSESSLHSYIISAGNWPGDDSLLTPTSLPPSTSHYTHTITPPLPTNITVYVNLVAINNAGKQTSASSDGVFIDDQPPSITDIAIDTEWAGSITTATQFSNTALRATWDSDNLLSPISSTSWSILSYPGTAIPRYPESLNGRESGTASGLNLKDGMEYSVSVSVCNAAGLCARSETHTPVLVDGSPPVDGFFAVETDSTFPRSVAVPDGMEWRNRPRAGDSRVTLSFYRFSDAHSNISEYWVEIGTGFGQSDLTQGPALLTPTEDTLTGSLTATVNTVGHVSVNQTIHISLWAVNGVGLSSHRVHSSFLVQKEEEEEENRGPLRIVRSSLCPLESCLGHCSCGARGDLCPLTTSDVTECEAVMVDAVAEEMRVGVISVSPQQPTGHTLFTAITDKLLGRWEVPDPIPFQRLEWTVGKSGGAPGSGLFDTSTDQIWREAGNATAAIFSVNPLLPLVHGETYLVYVRGWFNYTHYVVFGSNGVTVDVSGPRVVPGGRIREGGLGAEIDHTANQTNIEVTWNGVFIEELSEVHSIYEIGMGDIPGADNIIAFTSSLSLSLSLSSSLSHGRRYYTTLRATSPHLVSTETISDGFIADYTPPKVGVVFDGLSNGDEIAQSITDSLSARWTGFHDVESGIHHYEIAWSESPTPATDLEYENVGIGLRHTLSGLELNHGVTYYIHLAAVNGAWVWSQIVSSNGIAVDTTRPHHLQCQWETLNITSLEPISSGASPCEYSIMESELSVLHSPSFTPLSGCYSQLLTTPLPLHLHTSPNTLYTLSFWLARQPGGSGCGHQTPLGAKVTAPGVEEIVLVHTRNGDRLDGWGRFQFQFTADGPNSILTLSPLSDQYGIVIDDLAVSRCHSVDSIPFSDLATNKSSVFHVSQEHISGTWTRLRVRWGLGEDGEGVREYKWAIGTTQGGEQLQVFTSTGGLLAVNFDSQLILFILYYRSYSIWC